MGAWNFLVVQVYFSDVQDTRTDRRDCHLSQLSAELSRLGVRRTPPEVKRSGSGWSSERGYTYYWSGRPQEHLEGVSVAVVDRLVPMITEVTPLNERIMRPGITHTLGVNSLVSVYAPIGMSESSAKEAFYAQHHMVVDSRPERDDCPE